MDSDSNDSLPKLSRLSGEFLTGADSTLLSPVTLQMQRHLLSSTLQSSADAARSRSARTGSCSPPAVMSFAPTPSPSLFSHLSPAVTSSLPELNVALGVDSKQQSPHSSFYDMSDVRSVLSKYPDIVSLAGVTSGGDPAFRPGSIFSSPGVREASASLPAYSPHLDLGPSVLTLADHGGSLQAGLPVSSTHQNYLVMESTVASSLPSSHPVKLLPLSVGGPNIPESHQPVQPPPEARLRILSAELTPCLSLPAASQQICLAPLTTTTAPAHQICLTALPTAATTTTIASSPSHQQICLTALPPTTTSLAHQICLATLPAITTQSQPSHQLTCLGGMAPVTSQVDGIPVTATDVNSIANGNQRASSVRRGDFESYPHLVHPKKKQRLLTFLANQSSSSSGPTTHTDTYILSPSGPALVAVSSHNNTALIFNPAISSSIKPDSPVFISPSVCAPLEPPAKDTSEAAGTAIFFTAANTQPNTSSCNSHNSTSMSSISSPAHLFIGQEEGNLNKTEQTIIINSDGTQTRLITPVASAEAASVGGQTAAAMIESGENVALRLTKSFNGQAIFNSPSLAFPTALKSSLNVSPLVSSGMENVDMVSVNFVPRARESPVPEESLHSHFANFIEIVRFFKCKLCGYLSISQSGLVDHLTDLHEERFPDVRLEEESTWLAVAHREGVKLSCPCCPNLFTAERSFQVHLTEDHLLTETEAQYRLTKETAERKSKCLAILRVELERNRAERRRKRKEALEAYVDPSGELRIRRVPGILETSDPDEISEPRNLSMGQDQEAEFQMKASDYLAMVDQGLGFSFGAESAGCGKDAGKNTAKSAPQQAPAVEVVAQERQEAPKRKIGRPKGSRTYGVTALKKVNPNIEISDEIMGERCGINNCAVRLKSPVNLQIHRMSHCGASQHECPECQEQFATWQKCCLHLWREHGQDLELLSCDTCEYRCFTAAVMAKHQVSHSNMRCFLCPECGRAYKAKSQLTEHVRSVHPGSSSRESSPRGKDDEEDAAVATAASLADDVSQRRCELCNKIFVTAREVRYHKERVHEKRRPWSCHQCGYSAFSLKTLRIHFRSHTGAKPYPCGECDYRAGDHNALRRHSMRHTGERPYKCPHCPYAAIQSNCFKQHLRRKHMDCIDSGGANVPVPLKHTVTHTKEKLGGKVSSDGRIGTRLKL